MKATNSSHTTLMKEQSPLSTWVDGNKGRWAKWILIAVVVSYVAFLILAPLTALTFGAFEKGSA
jgi:ABC-type sulfate transport system permease subunit